MDFVKYNEKLREKSAVKVLREKILLEDKLSSVPFYSNLETGKIEFIDIRYNENSINRFIKRKEIATLIKNVNGAMYNSTKSYKENWFNLCAYFVGEYLGPNPDDINLNYFFEWQGGFMNSLSLQSLKYFQKYLEKFCEYVNKNNRNSIENAMILAKADLYASGVKGDDITYDYTLENNWEKYYNYIRKIELCNMELERKEKNGDTLADSYYLQLCNKEVLKQMEEREKLTEEKIRNGEDIVEDEYGMFSFRKE